MGGMWERRRRERERTGLFRSDVHSVGINGCLYDHGIFMRANGLFTKPDTKKNGCNESQEQQDDGSNHDTNDSAS